MNANERIHFRIKRRGYHSAGEYPFSWIPESFIIYKEQFRSDSEQTTTSYLPSIYSFIHDRLVLVHETEIKSTHKQKRQSKNRKFKSPLAIWLDWRAACLWHILFRKWTSDALIYNFLHNNCAGFVVNVLTCAKVHHRRIVLLFSCVARNRRFENVNKFRSARCFRVELSLLHRIIVIGVSLSVLVILCGKFECWKSSHTMYDVRVNRNRIYRFLHRPRQNINNLRFGGRCALLTVRRWGGSFQLWLPLFNFVGGMHRFVMSGEVVARCEFDTTCVVATGELLWRVGRMLFATMEIQLPLCSIFFVTVFDWTNKSAKVVMANKRYSHNYRQLLSGDCVGRQRPTCNTHSLMPICCFIWFLRT